MPDEQESPSPPGLPPAGWYPDPDDPESSQRYWDGRRWTGSYAPVGEATADPASPPRDLGTAQLVAVAGLTVTAVLAGFNIAADATHIAVLNDLIAGNARDPRDLADSRDLVDTATLVLGFAVFPLGPAVFLPWFHRAYTNLERLGLRNLRFTPGWAVGSWFVPILNLFRPKQIANDLQRATAGGTMRATGRLAGAAVSPLLHWWWAFFLASAFVGVAGIEYVTDEEPRGDELFAFESLTDERAFYAWQIVTSAVTIVAAVLAILVVRQITRDQHAVMAGPAATVHAHLTPPPGS